MKQLEPAFIFNEKIKHRLQSKAQTSFLCRSKKDSNPSLTSIVESKAAHNVQRKLLIEVLSKVISPADHGVVEDHLSCKIRKERLIEFHHDKGCSRVD